MGTLSYVIYSLLLCYDLLCASHKQNNNKTKGSHAQDRSHIKLFGLTFLVPACLGFFCNSYKPSSFICRIYKVCYEEIMSALGI